MSLVAFGQTTLDNNELSVATYDEGGVFVAQMDGTNLAVQDLTLEVRTQVNQDSGVVVHSKRTVSGPTPADPACVRIGPFVSTEPLELVAYLSTPAAANCDWKLQCKGRVSTVENGQGTVTGGAEVSLVTVPYGGTMLLLVDASAMQAGDTLKLRHKAKGGGPESGDVTVICETFNDAQDDQILQVWVEVDDGVEVTLEQSAGTGRSFPWSVVKVG